MLALCEGDDSVDLVSAGRDGAIILWRGGQAAETLKGQLVSAAAHTADPPAKDLFRGHGENIQGTNAHVVSALGRTSDGLLISGGWDKTVRLWKGTQQLVVMAGHDIAINAVAGAWLSQHVDLLFAAFEYLGKLLVWH